MPALKNEEIYQPLEFDAIKIGLASPEKILSWSRGEVKKPETINYRTLKPEKDGLFCEKIFGPSKDWECNCGKYKKIRFKGVICDRCGVEVTRAAVRRERMGHVALATPVSHIWYFKGIPSRMALILDISGRQLERVLYFASYVVLDPGQTSLEYKQILTEKEYRDALENYGYGTFRAGMGAEAVKELLHNIDLEKEAKELREELENATAQKRTKLVKRINVVDAFINSGNLPEWMIMDVIPVIPPDLRPMVQLDGGRFATSDLNDLYRRILNRNNRLAKMLELGAPDIIVRNEKRMLQEAVDALIDNGRRGRPVTGPSNRPLKSLSDMLKGKQGRFRQNLLGKRVDYSGRSVIVVGPELKIYQCGLPKEMAIELFKPFVMKELVLREMAHNIKSAKKMVERLEPAVFDVLEEVITEHPVMLNRAPTLHRLGIQAFEPILVEGKAIKLHPLVCTAFNADFDGDQMAVHLPLSVEAQAECRFLMLSTNNLLKPSDGGPVAVPSQDMVLGIYYLTQEREGTLGEGNAYKNLNEAILAYENGCLDLHARIQVAAEREVGGKMVKGFISSTLGRFLFNEIIQQDLGFVDRSIPENAFKLEIDFLVGKKNLKSILEKVINYHGAIETAETLDRIKAMGYKYSTRAAMTVSVSDMIIPEQKEGLVKEAEAKVEQISNFYRQGLITEEERYKQVVKTWEATEDIVVDTLMESFDKYNNIYMMADSGARGSEKQIKQLSGMRGLMSSTVGRTIELPVKSNFREGLDVLEYFLSAHGARKGLSDTALRTADSGYLTRRLVDVAQDLIIHEQDCAEGSDDIPYIEVEEFIDDNREIESLKERITGRTLAEDIKKGRKIIASKNELVTPDKAAEIVATGVEKVKIRSLLTCRCHVGVCAKCYGANLATAEPVQIGEAVGIIAAQSIGEPGTQLTMRTFHTGGVATADDITQGLPRVEELFEARRPKGLAIITEIDGIVSFRETKRKHEVVVTNPKTGDSRAYMIPYGSRTKVIEGQVLEAGDEITEGSIYPYDLLAVKGVTAVQKYMLYEVQKVYRSQGVDISDKHIEVIVRRMLQKVKIDDAGDSDKIVGTEMNILDFDDMNAKLEAEGKTPAKASTKLLGITKASLGTDSFLSAASFQETTRVLTEAAINGKIDPLVGLKENVIIGKLIPAGTGMKKYRSVVIDTDGSDLRDDDEPFNEAELSGEDADEPFMDAEQAFDGVEAIAKQALAEDFDEEDDDEEDAEFEEIAGEEVEEIADEDDNDEADA